MFIVSDDMENQRKTRKRTNQEIKKLVHALMKKMTIEEKIGQMAQTFYYSDLCTGPEFAMQDTIRQIQTGSIGSILNVYDPKKIYALQKVAVEESRLHIPLMFMLDIIHGFKTTFPTPLSMSCSFNEQLIKKVAGVAAKEASHSGISVTFSPMLDLIKDARWGRVNESNGEDAYVNKVLASAYIKGYQGKNLGDENVIGAVCKHFIGYGAVSAGREYNFSMIDDITLYQEYLPAFLQAFKDKAIGVMFAFQSYNHIPMSANASLTRDLLRKKLQYDGFSISDYGAVKELIAHKIASTDHEAAKLCLQAGLDIEMVSECYQNELSSLCKKEKKYMTFINEACERILTAKYRLGLFDNPYKHLYPDANSYCLLPESIALSYQMACQSIVMLKNENLPLHRKMKICLLGPYAKSKKIVGPWGGVSASEDNVSVYEAFSQEKDIDLTGETDEEIRNSDVCILCLGEDDWMAGEGGSRVDLSLPKQQEQLLFHVANLQENIVLVLFSGRPLVLTPYLDRCRSILFSFYLGMQGGNAIRDLLLGRFCPSGKLSVSFPRHVGQLPLTYQNYSSGRPKKENQLKYERYVTHYVDCENTPLFPFSFGLSYNEYEYKNFRCDKRKLKGKKDKLFICFEVENHGNYASEEIAFLFVEALQSDVTRPDHELRFFKRFAILPHEVVSLQMEVNFDTLKYYNQKLRQVVKDGRYKIKIGSNLLALHEITIDFVNE